MKVLVTGVNGQLGHDMMLELKRRGHDPIGSGSGPEYRGHDSVAAMPYEQMNITDAQNVQDVLKRLQPDAVVHCSAWTAAAVRSRIIISMSWGSFSARAICWS